MPEQPGQPEQPEQPEQLKPTDANTVTDPANDISPPLAWSHEIDTLLASWCDNAKCFEWMHTEAYSEYERRSKFFMVSINSLTAISGVSNVIAGGYTIGGFQISWLFGGISVAVSTLTMLQDKLGYQVSSQIHKRMASDWASIRLKIDEVITLPYAGRRDCKTFLRYIKVDLNKATIDGNSIIPKHIRVACFKRFSSIVNFDIPDICGHMEHTKIYIPATAPSAGTLNGSLALPLLIN